jgi:hypothetical protein
MQKNFPSVDSGASSRHLRAMQAIKVEAIVKKEGELHLTNLPVHPDQQVEVIVLIPEKNSDLPGTSPLAVDDQEWQTLVDSIRQSEPHFSTLDEAMNVTRRRS